MVGQRFGALCACPPLAEEDDRRLHRERRRLIGGRIQHVNRIKGPLAIHGIYDYQPLAVVDGHRRTVEADLGPVRYLATLIGVGDQDVLRWFILVVALLPDPAAVLLVLAATRR